MLRRSAKCIPFVGTGVLISASRHSSSSASAAASSEDSKRFVNPADALIRQKLLNCKTLVVVGLSTDESKPSYHVVEQMLQRPGQDAVETKINIIPVRPLGKGQELKILGFPVRGSLADVPELKEDSTIVDIFRKSSDVPPILRELQKSGAKNVWLQRGVVADEACNEAREQGMFVVQDKCVLLEHQRLVSEQW